MRGIIPATVCVTSAPSPGTMRLLLSCAAFTIAVSAASAQGDSSTNLPLVADRVVRFATSEGTWMSVDVSPDGHTIVFDLLGDLYTVPIDGGQAARLTSGLAFDAQPRWSPDGSLIAFVSDRSGAQNLWVIDAS